jgi:hypothetical protein
LQYSAHLLRDAHISTNFTGTEWQMLSVCPVFV